MRVNLMWAGMILLVFGITLVASSYFNLYYWGLDPIGPLELSIAKKSSGDYMLYMDRTADMKKIEVHVYHGRLDILNKTGYNYLWNFSLTLADYVVLQPYSQNVSVSMYPDTFPVTHVFDIPDNWRWLGKITVTNQEDFSAFVIVEAVLHRQLVNDSWRIVMYSGIVSIAIGIALLLYHRYW